MMFPLGLGNDICHIPRIYRILASRHGPRFVARVLTPAEQQEGRPRALLQCVLPPPPGPPAPPKPLARFAADDPPGEDDVAGATRNPDIWKAAVFMAGRFAAKEAAIKAHPHRRLTFQLIRVRIRPTPPGAGPADARSSGPPVAVIKGDAPGRPDTAALLSISHDGDYAAAVCLAVQTPDGSGGSGSSSSFEETQVLDGGGSSGGSSS